MSNKSKWYLTSSGTWQITGPRYKCSNCGVIQWSPKKFCPGCKRLMDGFSDEKGRSHFI